MIDSVPLIQNANDAQQINASIIAMKKASRELDEKIVKLNSLNSELDKKIALLDSGLNKEIEDRKEAINSLDVPSVGGSGKYISAISETDGKISATASDITSSVSSGNSQPVTSGGVAEAKYTKIFITGLSVSGWYKIASLSPRGYGSSVMIDLWSSFNYQYNSSHKVQINYGWLKAEVLDFAQDEQTVFDKIRICYNSNNFDQMAIYVHYTPNSANNVGVNINAGTLELTPVNFETDSLTWENTIEYNLGSSGLYINGQSHNLIDSVTSGNLQPVTSNAVANSNAMPVNSVTSGNMHSVTSNAVAEALKYKDDWQTNQIIETDKFFQGVRLKNYLASTVNQTSGIYYFSLPEVPNNIIDVRINVEDGNNNVISDGYNDGPYTLAWAYIKADNTIRVAWGGWTTLRSITMFLTYR